MEFKALKNIETAYQQLRRYSMAFLGLCALITVVAPYGGRTATPKSSVRRFTCWTTAKA